MNDFNSGVNLGGWLSQYPAYQEEHFQTFITEKDFAQLAAWKLDHLRLPVDYPVIEANEAGLHYLDQALIWAKKYDLNLILDLHHAPGFVFHSPQNSKLFSDLVYEERFLKIWQMLATRYANEGESLIFELLNEVVLPESTPWNKLAQKTVSAIRQIDPTRKIIIGSNNYGSLHHLKELEMVDDPHLIYTFHFYEPMYFTHQKASWMPSLNESFHYPGTADALIKIIDTIKQSHPEMVTTNILGFEKYLGKKLDHHLLEEELAPALEFITKTGKPLYCGEYGVIDNVPLESRIKWQRDLVAIFRELKIGRACWTYKGLNFSLTDQHGAPISEALISSLR